MSNISRGAVLAGSTLAILLSAASVAWGNYYGTRYYNNIEYGNISSITAPTGSQQPPNANELYLHRSIVQSAISTSAGLVQAGWATVGSNILFDNCGNTSSATYDFVEWRPVNGVYSCYLYTQWSGGTDFNFNVYVNSNGWNVKIDGSVDPDGPWHINAADGYGMVGGEDLNGSGKAAACYGQGASSWNYYNAPGNGGAGSILVSPNSSTGQLGPVGNWTVGPAPSPLCDNLT